MKSGHDALPKSSIHNDLATIYLKQGEYYISNKSPVLVKTVLGSCVTVTMFCPVLHIGAITHSLLPLPLSGTEVPPGHEGRFVASSVKYVFKRLSSLKVKRNRLEVKIFGGGQMLLHDLKHKNYPTLNIGRRNVETALKTIQELDLSITATDVGGTWGRKLIFCPHQGDVWVKKIHRIVNQKSNGSKP